MVKSYFCGIGQKYECIAEVMVKMNDPILRKIQQHNLCRSCAFRWSVIHIEETSLLNVAMKCKFYCLGLQTYVFQCFRKSKIAALCRFGFMSSVCFNKFRTRQCSLYILFHNKKLQYCSNIPGTETAEKSNFTLNVMQPIWKKN